MSGPNPKMSLAAEQLMKAAKAKKCWACDCLRSTLMTVDGGIPAEKQTAKLRQAVIAAKDRLLPPEIDCRGCPICYPAIAMNALAEGVEPETLDPAVCPAEEIHPREGWPPLAGDYTALGYHRPVAVCTLNSENLWRQLIQLSPRHVSICGILHTENLGIERLIKNITANPNIRFLILCGEDSRRQIGHLPGQSLSALNKNGIDERARIIGANGKRPVLRNIDPEMVEHFRKSVEIVDLIGTVSPVDIIDIVEKLAQRNPGPGEPYMSAPVMPAVRGYIPDKMISDPDGYFVIYPDALRGAIYLEHYGNNGVLTTIIEGKTAAELYHPAVEKRLLSRLDHACYLGRELARAEQAILKGELYVQDAAPEKQTPKALSAFTDACCGGKRS